MALSPRSIAVDGIGFGALHVALAGLIALVPTSDGGAACAHIADNTHAAAFVVDAETASVLLDHAGLAEASISHVLVCAECRDEIATMASVALGFEAEASIEDEAAPARIYQSLILAVIEDAAFASASLDDDAATDSIASDDPLTSTEIDDGKNC